MNYTAMEGGDDKNRLKRHQACCLSPRCQCLFAFAPVRDIYRLLHQQNLISLVSGMSGMSGPSGPRSKAATAKHQSQHKHHKA